jgi:hypothetical protein
LGGFREGADVALISKIGPLEISLISFFGALFLYRIQAPPESRIATALFFIFSARFGGSFINGFSISEATKLSFGQLDTVFAYLMLAFAFLEVLLLKRVSKWQRSDLWVMGGLFGFGILNLIWKLAFSIGLSANDFLYTLVLLLTLSLRPTRVDLKFLPYLGALLILMVALTALFKYQNPLFPYRNVDYGLGSQYQNRLWIFLGWDERFRGPYYHPNQLGIQITFLSLLVLMKSSKFYIGILPISFAILFLASSRTSILALSVGLLVRVYFDVTRGDKVAQPANMAVHPSGSYFLNVSMFRKLLAGCVVATVTISIALRIVGTNATGTGRLENYQNTFSGSRESLFLGRGPSLFSINSTENTILTILSYYGIVGVILLVAILIGLITKVRKLTRHEKSSVMIGFSVFLVASTGESLITGAFIDNGIFYITILLLLTRLESPLVELPQT